MSRPGFLLVDANVLVDYQSADLAILSLVSRHVGTVHIVSSVLAEVDEAAQRIHRANPVFVNGLILAAFREKLGALETRCLCGPSSRRIALRGR